MNKYHIALTKGESALVKKIDLRVRHLNHDEGHEANASNKEPILALLKSLYDRNAIPDERLRYWNHPEYNIGQIKTSYRGEFESNGCHGDDIYIHPHFIPFLQYFLFGADLPGTAITAFESSVGNPDWITSGDVVRISKSARDIARNHQLDRHAREEFFKLCLDLGLGLSNAESVWRTFKS